MLVPMIAVAHLLWLLWAFGFLSSLAVVIIESAITLLYPKNYLTYESDQD